MFVAAIWWLLSAAKGARNLLVERVYVGVRGNPASGPQNGLFCCEAVAKSRAVAAVRARRGRQSRAQRRRAPRIGGYASGESSPAGAATGVAAALRSGGG